MPKGVKPVWINCFWDGANNDKPAELMPQKTWGPDCHTSSIRLKWPTDPTLKAQMANQPLAICANVFTNRNAPYSARLKCRNEDRVFTDLIDDIRDHKDDANYIGVRVGWRYVVRGRRWVMVSVPNNPGSKIHWVFVPRYLLPKDVADWKGTGANPSDPE